MSVAFPAEESELIRRYTLTRADRTFIRQHRVDRADGHGHFEGWQFRMEIKDRSEEI